jgi:hypothetical protein
MLSMLSTRRWEGFDGLPVSIGVSVGSAYMSSDGAPDEKEGRPKH